MAWLPHWVHSNSFLAHSFLPVLCFFMLKGEVLFASDQWATVRLSVAIFGKSDLGQTQNILKGLFMDLGMPWDLGIWLRPRTPSLLCLGCRYNELDASKWWKMNILKCFHSTTYSNCRLQSCFGVWYCLLHHYYCPFMQCVQNVDHYAVLIMLSWLKACNKRKTGQHLLISYIDWLIE